MLQTTLRRALILTLSLSALAAGPVFADATRLGVTLFGSAGGQAGVRFPKAAYGTTPNVYLVVHGQGGITGRFFSADGAPIGGQFLVTANPNAIAPTVTYSQLRNVFFVAWLEERPEGVVVTGRVLSFAGGGPQFLTGMFNISGGGPKFLDAAPAVAYSSLSDVFLVAWSSMDGGLEVLAQRVLHTGQPLGGPIPIGVTPGIWELYPSVAYNSSQDEFFVVFTSEKEGVAFPFRTAGTRVLADSGTSFPPVMLYEAEFNNYPEVAYNSNANEYLAISYVNSAVLGVGGGDVLGRRVNGSGQPIGPVLPVGATANFEGGDGIGLAFNAKTNSYLAVFQGVGDLTHASEVMANGAVHPVFMAMTGNPTYQPKVAADSERGRWLIVNSTGFTQSSVQLIASSGAGPIAPAPGGGGGGPAPASTPLPQQDINLSGGSHAPNGSWYFAEGAVSGPPLNFRTYYLITNPHDVDVGVRAYFSNENGVSYRADFGIKARSRRTYWLPDGMPPGAYGAVFQSKMAGRQIYVERSMYWGPNFEGSHTEAGANQTRSTWYFAEGSRKGEFFKNYILLFNPTQSPVNGALTFYPADAGPTFSKAFTLGPQQRKSIDLSTFPELAGRDFGTRVTSSLGIVAERSMYWGASWVGGTNSMGSPNVSPGWLFAEGATAPGFDTYYLLLNPNVAPITVAVTYLREHGGPLTKNYVVPGTARRTIHVNGQVGNIGGVGARLVSTGGEPFLVERSVYWGNGTWVEGHTDIGSPGAAKVWYLPEGTTNAGFNTYVAIANPGMWHVDLNVTVYLENGQQQTLLKTVHGKSRLTIPMRTFLAQAGLNPNNQNFSTRVAVAGSTPAGSVVVEHAIYKQPDGANFWRAGGAAMGLR